MARAARSARTGRFVARKRTRTNRRGTTRTRVRGRGRARGRTSRGWLKAGTG